MTKVEKMALLLKAFLTEEGTRAVYRAAKLPEPKLLAPTVKGRVKALHEAVRRLDEGLDAS